MAKSAAGGRTATRELLQRRLEAQWIVPPPRGATGSAGDGGAPAIGAAAAGDGPRAPRNGATAGRGEHTPANDATAAVAGAPPRGIAGVARHLLALQAQDFGQAVWALGLRSPGSTRADVDAALDNAEVVRSWPMRGTLHFSTPDDLRMMLSLTAKKTVTGVAARHRQLDLNDDDFARAGRIAASELRGGASFSRDEFFALLEADGIRTTGQRGVHIIWWLAHDGLLCWGPTRGTQQALVLLDEWAPTTRDPHTNRDDALAEFVLRYFTGHGPATLKDFCWWSKSTVADAQRGLARVRDRLIETELDGATYWMRDPADRDDSASSDAASRRGGDTSDPTRPDGRTPGDVPGRRDRDASGAPGRHDDAATGRTGELRDGRTIRTDAASAHPSPRRSSTGVHALPGFDEYLLGYQDRSHALPAGFFDRIVPGNNGIFLPMIVSRGAIVGTWRRAVTAKKATVTPEPFTALSGAERSAFAREVARYGHFLGVPASLADDGGATPRSPRRTATPTPDRGSRPTPASDAPPTPDDGHPAGEAPA